LEKLSVREGDSLEIKILAKRFFSGENHIKVIGSVYLGTSK
jgi:hypothetical protein